MAITSAAHVDVLRHVAEAIKGADVVFSQKLPETQAFMESISGTYPESHLGQSHGQGGRKTQDTINEDSHQREVILDT